MSLLATWLASPPPDAAIEIAADRVAAAVVVARGDRLAVSAYASDPIAPGLITPSLTETNVHDRGELARVVQRVVEKLGVRPKRVALVIPDTAVKVSLLRFDKVPQRRDDFEQLVRWQLRKAAPFPIESACVTTSPGLSFGEGQEFVVELSREDTVREYEAACEDAGLYAGLVETATFGLLGLEPHSSQASGDALLVHVRPDYTSTVITRGDAVIFYRNRPEDGHDGLPDLVHQTSMYYQDRLSGQGFSRVLLAGAGRAADAVGVIRQALEERLGGAVELLDPTQAASLPDRITASPELMDVLGPSIGLLRRTRIGAAA
jgi:Tfp pilus assembly PilM family ATPase